MRIDSDSRTNLSIYGNNLTRINSVFIRLMTSHIRRIKKSLTSSLTC